MDRDYQMRSVSWTYNFWLTSDSRTNLEITMKELVVADGTRAEVGVVLVVESVCDMNLVTVDKMFTLPFAGV